MDYSGNSDSPQPAEPNHYVASYPPEELNTEFKRKYPPDPFGEEMRPNARVWKVYKDEVTPHDKSLLDGWNKTLDILLIFAGLFSAVATAFIIESYKLLQPDYEEYIANALFIALSTRNGSGALDQVLDLASPSDFAALGSSRWLNGLWFTSLVLSLIVAFLCILLKQWLEEYNSRTSAPFASVRQWARRRTFYFVGLGKWGVPVLIAILPLLLHAALFLFLVGLSVLLWTLDVATALWTVVVTSGLLCFYGAATLLPFLRADCPSSTPLIGMLRAPIRTACLRMLYVVSGLALERRARPQWSSDYVAPTRLHHILRQASQVPAFLSQRALASGIVLFYSCIPTRWRVSIAETFWRLHEHFRRSQSQPTTLTFGHQFSRAEKEHCDALALRWLITICPSVDAIVTGFDAVGARPPWGPAARLLREHPGLRAIFRRSLQTIHARAGFCTTADIAREIRSGLCLFGAKGAVGCVGFAASRSRLDTVMTGSSQYDLPFMRDCISTALGGRRVVQLRELLTRCSALPSRILGTSPHFLASTALQFLYHEDIPLSAWLQICRLLPLSTITVPDFVVLISTLLRHRQYDKCPLQDLHEGSRCRVQCSFELLSEIINSSEDLGLSNEDAHAGLDIILTYGATRVDAFADFRASTQKSQLLVLLGSDLLVTHSHRALLSNLMGLVLNLGSMAHSFQRSRGLPHWSDDWTHTFTNIIAVTFHLPQTMGEHVGIKIPMAVTKMFNVHRPAAHVRVAHGDSTEHLPLTLLDGGDASVWQLLFSLPQIGPTKMGQEWLANLLAASLCIAARRGMDVTSRLMTFVNGSHIIERLQLLDPDDQSNSSLWRRNRIETRRETSRNPDGNQHVAG